MESVNLDSRTSQLLKAAEEPCELSRAVVRYLDNSNKDTLDNLLEEIADTIIIIKKLYMLLDKEINPDVLDYLTGDWSIKKHAQLDEVISELKLNQ